MSDATIVCSGLGIAYRRYYHKVVTLKEVFTRRFRGSQFKPFWALRNISFEVPHGEILGIIGPNGSGKSTLLKAITRVLEPTEGSVVTRGRIAPLIELGAGFNPDLTGRENIFLNGSILGFSRREMEAKYERIVAFSGLSGFIDTPVRNYSSGMVVRLGFAIATDIDPDILIMDEVFSIGDEEFHRKSSERVASLIESDATVLIVSHNLEMVRKYCRRVILLWKGEVQMVGESGEVITEYRRRVQQFCKPSGAASD